MKTFRIFSRIVLIFIAIALIPSCAVNPVTGKKQLMFMSEEQEIALGAQYDPSVVATMGQYQDAKIQAFIDQKGKEMGLISHRPNLQYHFKIVDSPVINAFAVPGGYIYFTRGILAQLNNEAELMGIMGHEMGHVVYRHTASQQTKQTLAQVALIGGMIASKQIAQYAEQAMQGMQLLFFKFSRDNEREADQIGVEYSTKIGYDAHKMADFFAVLKKMELASENGGVPTFMSTHPDPGDRYNTVHQLATKAQAQSATTSQWLVNTDQYLRMIDGLVYGEDPRQGFVENSVFYHPEMKFRYNIPSGWKFENTPTQVNMAQPDGKALMIFTMAQQKSAAEAATATLQQLQLQMLENKPTTINGMPAVLTVSQQTQQDQQTGKTSVIKILSGFIEYGGGVYVFHGLSSDVDFNTYFKSFETGIRSFDRLTDPAKLNVVPKRIRVQPVKATGTMANALKAYNIPDAQLKDIAFLNNIELTEQVTKGKLIKLIGN